MSDLRQEEERIKALYDEAVREVQRNREKQMYTRVISTGLCALVILIVFSVLFNTAQNKTKKEKAEQYAIACSLYEEKLYVKAREEFEKLGNYEESEKYIANIDTIVGSFQEKYFHAKELMTVNEYKEAIPEFSQIRGYQDSDELFELCNEKIIKMAEEKKNEKNYETALTLLSYVSSDSEHTSDATELSLLIENLQNQEYMELGKAYFAEEEYATAKDILGKIPNSSIYNAEAQSLMNEIDNCIKEREMAEKYNSAKEAYFNSDFENAQKQFIALGTQYSDVKEYLDSIAKQYYDKAINAKKNKKYIEAVTYAININEQREWSEYDKALSLIDECKSAYVKDTRAGAEKEYKKNGYKAMKDYLTSATHTLIFTKADYQDLLDKYGKVKVKDLKPYYTNAGTSSSFGWHYYTAFSSKDFVDLKGLEHKNALFGDCTNKYRINGEYAKLEGTLYLTVNDYQSGSMRIIGDDKELFYIKSAETSYKKEFSIDLSGVNTLEIILTSQYEHQFDYFGIDDFVLVRD